MADLQGLITIPGGMLGSVGCVCGDDGMDQTVTLNWPGNNNIVFQGSLRGAPMVMADGQMTAELAYSDTAYQIAATSVAGGQDVPFLAPTVQTPSPGITTITMISQQPGQGFWSAAVLVMLFSTDSEKILSANPSAASSEVFPWSGDDRAQPVETASDYQLVFTATVYYMDGKARPDKHIFTWPYSSSTTLDYSGTFWSLASSKAYDVPTPVGGYLTFEADLWHCTHPGMQDALLDLSTSCGYWWSLPTSFKSPQWNFQPNGNWPYRIKRVTP
jgi:hypothetical protein